MKIKVLIELQTTDLTNEMLKEKNAQKHHVLQEVEDFFTELLEEETYADEIIIENITVYEESE